MNFRDWARSYGRKLENIIFDKLYIILSSYFISDASFWADFFGLNILYLYGL